MRHQLVRLRHVSNIGFGIKIHPDQFEMKVSRFV
jgi:hypothetical protein